MRISHSPLSSCSNYRCVSWITEMTILNEKLKSERLVCMHVWVVSWLQVQTEQSSRIPIKILIRIASTQHANKYSRIKMAGQFSGQTLENCVEAETLLNIIHRSLTEMEVVYFGFRKSKQDEKKHSIGCVIMTRESREVRGEDGKFNWKKKNAHTYSNTLHNQEWNHEKKNYKRRTRSGVENNMNETDIDCFAARIRRAWATVSFEVRSPWPTLHYFIRFSFSLARKRIDQQKKNQKPCTLRTTLTHFEEEKKK